MDFDKSSVSREEYFHMLSIMQIKNDAETLKALAPIISHPVIVLDMLPYLALFCNSAIEYLNMNNCEVSLPNESIFSIKDLRSKLKLFDERIGKATKQVKLSDGLQDKEFRGKLRFPWTRGLNIHYNLGIFCDEQGHIIGNTQYTYFLFQDKRFTKVLDDSNEIRALGKSIGTTINSVCEGLKNFQSNFVAKTKTKDFKIYYKDFNTNRKFNAFPNLTNGKELTLHLLHILTFVNSMRYVIDPIMDGCNPWLLRTKYITTYYAQRNLEKVMRVPENVLIASRIKNSVNFSTDLFDSEFRSCMMHYGFSNHERWSIADCYLDVNTLFYGLVESRFNGYHPREYSELLSHRLIEISDTLNKMLSINLSGAQLLR